jgi:hypothetical protein
VDGFALGPAHNAAGWGFNPKDIKKTNKITPKVMRMAKIERLIT